MLEKKIKSRIIRIDTYNQNTILRMIFSENELCWQTKITVVSPYRPLLDQVYLFCKESWNLDQVEQESIKMIKESASVFCY